MNKVKMFFIAAALVLTTAGVFAGKAKFSATGVLYSYNAATSTYNQISTGSDAFTGLNTSGTTAATILPNSGGAAQPLYLFTAPSTYAKVYTAF